MEIKYREMLLRRYSYQAPPDDPMIGLVPYSVNLKKGF